METKELGKYKARLRKILKKKSGFGEYVREEPFNILVEEVGGANFLQVRNLFVRIPETDESFKIKFYNVKLKRANKILGIKDKEFDKYIGDLYTDKRGDVIAEDVNRDVLSLSDINILAKNPSEAGFESKGVGGAGLFNFELEVITDVFSSFFKKRSIVLCLSMLLLT